MVATYKEIPAPRFSSAFFWMFGWAVDLSLILLGLLGNDACFSCVVSMLKSSASSGEGSPLLEEDGREKDDPREAAYAIFRTRMF